MRLDELEVLDDREVGWFQPDNLETRAICEIRNDVLDHCGERADYPSDDDGMRDQDHAIRKHGLMDVVDLEIACFPPVDSMRRSGLRVDVARLSRELQGARVRLEEAADGWDRWCVKLEFGEVDPRSQKGVLESVRRLGYRVDGLDDEGLSGVTHPLVRAYQEHTHADEVVRELERFRPAVNSDGFLKGKFRQVGTVTGRMTSRELNLMGLRSEHRHLIIADPDHAFVIVDIRALELGVLAALSRDERLLAAVLGKGDLHRAMAAILFDVREDEVTPDLRMRAKPVNLGVMYGTSIPALAAEIGGTYQDASAAVQRWKDAFPRAASYFDDQAERAVEKRVSHSLLGRYRRYPADMDKSTTKRRGRNFSIQATGAELHKAGLAAIDAALYARRLGRIALTVHDSYLISTPLQNLDDVRSVVAEVFAKPLIIDVPLPVSIGVGPTWAAAERDAREHNATKSA